jgi:hypothetical protein
VNAKTHQQSRWELVGATLVGVLAAVAFVTLMVWALTTPVTTPPERMPQVAVTEYVEA